MLSAVSSPIPVIPRRRCRASIRSPESIRSTSPANSLQRTRRKALSRLVLTRKYPDGRIRPARTSSSRPCRAHGSRTPSILEPSNGLFHIGPVRVLRQDRPDGNLKGRLPRPPVKIPVEPVQRLINPQQTPFRIPRFVFRKPPLARPTRSAPPPGYSFLIAT